jgi:hypothetical protein
MARRSKGTYQPPTAAQKRQKQVADAEKKAAAYRVARHRAPETKEQRNANRPSGTSPEERWAHTVGTAVGVYWVGGRPKLLHRIADLDPQPWRTFPPEYINFPSDKIHGAGGRW